MSNLKKNMITLIKNPEEVNKGGEPDFERVWTVPFISLRVAREGANLVDELYESVELSEDEKIDKMADFVASKLYGDKITKDDLLDRMPSPGMEGYETAQVIIERQILFATLGEQTEETKNFLAEKK